MIRFFFILAIPALAIMLSFIISTDKNELDFFKGNFFNFRITINRFLSFFYLKSEKYYDLFGGLTFVSSILLMLFLKFKINSDLNIREIILASCTSLDN